MYCCSREINFLECCLYSQWCGGDEIKLTAFSQSVGEYITGTDGKSFVNSISNPKKQWKTTLSTETSETPLEDSFW